MLTSERASLNVVKPSLTFWLGYEGAAREMLDRERPCAGFEPSADWQKFHGWQHEVTKPS